MAKPVTPESAAAETIEVRKRRASTILRRLREHHEPVCALMHSNPFELLVATILSAQSTDEQVNKVTPGLFAKYPDAAAFAAASQTEMEQAINNIGLFRNKAKSLRGAARMIVDEFGGTVPKTMKQLLRLPGVARKTANVVLGTGYGIASGVTVDTHVTRLAFRLGLTTETDPPKIERDLMALFPRSRWIEGGHTLIWHGRRVCGARRPDCTGCFLSDLCPKNGVASSS